MDLVLQGPPHGFGGELPGYVSLHVPWVVVLGEGLDERGRLQPRQVGGTLGADEFEFDGHNRQSAASVEWLT